jgi:Plasmid replication region DNA-binding N-term
MAQPPTKVEAAVPAHGADLRQRGKNITRDELFECAQNLMLRGERPSGDRIRDIIGGSPHKIGPWLEEFWIWLGSLVAPALKKQSIPGVPKPVAQTALQLWNVALDCARQELQTNLAERETAIGARERAAEDLERQAAEREQAAAASAAGLKEALKLATDQLALANQRVKVLEQQLAGELTVKRAEVERLTRRLDRTTRHRTGSGPRATDRKRFRKKAGRTRKP